MDTDKTLPNAKIATRTSRRIGWPFLGYWLAHILLLAFAAWPVVLETFEPSKFVESEKVCRAVHRHFRQKSLIDIAMQSAVNSPYASPMQASAE